MAFLELYVPELEVVERSLECLGFVIVQVAARFRLQHLQGFDEVPKGGERLRHVRGGTPVAVLAGRHCLLHLLEGHGARRGEARDEGGKGYGQWSVVSHGVVLVDGDD